MSEGDGDDDPVLDFGRPARTGLAEAVLCEGKTPRQIAAALRLAAAAGQPLLLTRLSAEAHAALPADATAGLDYDPESGTALRGRLRPLAAGARVAIVAAGTSDAGVAGEARRTLAFHGEPATVIVDVGVAGLWRLEARLDEIRRHPVVIAVAGMEGALFSVLGGLVPGVLVCVPTSRGYGVADGGRLALHAALGSCAPGLVAVNIDNGFGAAGAALRALGAAPG